MSVIRRRSLSAYGATVCALFLVAGTADAQSVTLRLVEEADGRSIYELEAFWPRPLGEVLDSLGAQALEDDAILTVTGGLTLQSTSLELPSLAGPQVSVLSSAYDEYAVPADTGRTLLADASGPVASIVGLGWERKRPAATLLVRTVTYDASAGVLRRYRRVRVAVGPGPQPLAGKAQHQAPARIESVLASGIIYKIAVREEGIYQIDRAFFEALPGFSGNLSSIDPEEVRVFGNGGAPLPALNSAPRPVDLVENQVIVRGGGDGSFDEGDAVWFYGAPPWGWKAVQQRDRSGRPVTGEDGQEVFAWEHYVNPFSSENYYFIKIGSGTSAALEREPFPDLAAALRLDQVTGRHVQDMDDYLWSREAATGHTWVSNTITTGGAELPVLESVRLPGLASGRVRYSARAAVQSNPATDLFFLSGGTTLATANLGAVVSSSTTTVARSGIVEFEQDVSDGQALSLGMRLGSQDNNAMAAVDWLRVFYPKALRAAEGPLRFHTPVEGEGAFEAVLSGYSGEPWVLDITEPGGFRWLSALPFSGGHRVQVEVSDRGQPRELVAFAASDVRAIDVEEACGESCRVQPQNLHGIESWPDLVIVAPAVFLPQASELAALRREEGLTVEVVDVEQIFNEFAGGLRDIRGMRDYFKFLYDRASTEDQLLRYVLFYGDGHFNYRNLGTPEPEIPNLIPPFETEESWFPEESFTSDDYFGLLDDNEGLWPFTRQTFIGSNEHLNERVDIGIGRFTVYTEDQAQTVLDKMRHYGSSDSYGPWRQRYLFIADDGPTGTAGTQNDRDLHTQNTDVVAETVARRAPEIDQEKVYALSYTREFRNAWRVPGARQDILSAIRSGVLVVNYSGHGAEQGLAQEDLFNIEDARTLTNYDALPVFITATCSFGRWDLAGEQSGAEELLTNPDGGAIALLTTVRSVYTSGNAQSLNVGLNVALNDQLFRKDEEGLPRRLGDALRLTKNTRVGFEGNNRKFNLLGDPSMRLGVPDRSVVVTSINDEPLTGRAPQLRALERVTVAGEVRQINGSLDAAFGGTVSLTVFDADRRIVIPPEMYQFMPRAFYTVREDLIWRGRTGVTDGRFEATFVVPKDISYSDRPGRISAYGSSDQAHALGFTENFVVGGTASDVPDDADGPEIELFLGDETFVSGQLTSPRPELLVKLFDESGINTVGAGVGHEMLLVVDGDEQNAVEIGGLYESEEDSYQRGRVRYSFAEPLDAGNHTVSVRAWDVLNNSGRQSLEFVVAESEALQIRNMFNYPNPTTGPTRFVFEHNQPVGTPVRVRIRIYSLAGRPIRTVETDEVLPGGAMQVMWDGTDDEYSMLSPGVYLYQVRVEVDGAGGDRQVSEAIERLAIVR